MWGRGSKASSPVRRHELCGGGLLGDLLAGDDVDADVAGPPHQVVHDGPVQDLEPARPRGFADDDLRDVILVREADHVVGDAACAGGERDGLAAEALGQAHGLGNAVPLGFGELRASPRLDAKCGPGRVQAIGKTLRIAHERRRARILADAHEQPLARGPRPGNGAGLHLLEQLLVHALRRAPQGELAQGREIGRREVVLERPLGLLGDVDLALLQALDQVVGRQVDELDGIGAVEDGVGHRLAHAHAGDLRHDIVQAFDVLDIDRGIDVDALLQQLLDIEVALGMPAAGGIGVRELVDQDQLRAPLERGIEIELAEDAIDVDHRLAREDLEALEQGLRLLAAVRLDHADDDVHALLPLGASRLQHLISLADAWGRTDKDLETAGADLLLALGLSQQGLRRGSLLRLAPLVCHRSKARQPACAPPSACSSPGVAKRLAADVRLNELAHAIFGHIARVRNEGPQ